MVSKDEYYRRKAADLCTKCGKTREGSPSKARCLACHNKLKNKPTEQSEISSEQLITEDEKKLNIERLKKQTLLSKSDEIIKKCGVCQESIGSFNLFCQVCLKDMVFTKEDALVRYGACCCSCAQTDLKQLRLVSSDIGIPMAKHGSELYRIVCYRRIKPNEYKAQCYSCYWRDSVSHTRQLKALFYQGHYLFEDEVEEDEEDMIDIS